MNTLKFAVIVLASAAVLRAVPGYTQQEQTPQQPPDTAITTPPEPPPPPDTAVTTPPLPPPPDATAPAQRPPRGQHEFHQGQQWQNASTSGWHGEHGGHDGLAHPMIGMGEMHAAIQWAREKQGAKFDQLMALRQKDPQAFHNQMRDLIKAYMQEKRPDDVQRFKERRESDLRLAQLSADYRKVQDPTRKLQLQIQIRAQLEKEFDARKQARQKEIQQLESRIAELHKTIETRDSNRQQMIDARLKNLTDAPAPVKE